MGVPRESRFLVPYHRIESEFKAQGLGRAGAQVDRNFQEIERTLEGVGETIIFDQIDDAVAVSESDDVPVRAGGRPTVIAQLIDPLTTAATVTFARNGTVFATETLATGDTQQVFGPYTEEFDPRDRARSAVTAAGAGGTGLVLVWEF